MERRQYVVMIDRDDDMEAVFSSLEDARRMAVELNEELEANGLERTAYVAVLEYERDEDGFRTGESCLVQEIEVE